MDEHWQERVAFLVSVLASTYGRQVSPAMLQGYLVGLQGLGLPEIESAVKRGIQTRKFMPTPAEIRELAGEIPPGDAALIAWEIACGAASTYGWYHSVAFEDAAITASIRSLGGWQHFCERCGGDEEKWLRKQFIEAYAVYRRVGVSVEAAMPMPGEFERRNRLLGFTRDEDAPVLVRSDGRVMPLRALPRGSGDVRESLMKLSDAMAIQEDRETSCMKGR